MGTNIVLLVLSTLVLFNGAEALMCHRCNSAMGGCGEDLQWWMFPWKGCGDSQFCVKVVEKVGSDETILRECVNNLMRSTQHRLEMPGVRRHGYCVPARNHPKTITYCFCNDWNGCNSASGLSIRILPVSLVSVLVTIFISKFM